MDIKYLHHTADAVGATMIEKSVEPEWYHERITDGLQTIIWLLVDEHEPTARSIAYPCCATM